MTTLNISLMTESLVRLMSFSTENPPGRELEAAQYLMAELESAGCDVAHKPDEFVPIDEFANASLIYSDIAQKMLSPTG